MSNTPSENPPKLQKLEWYGDTVTVQKIMPDQGESMDATLLENIVVGKKLMYAASMDNSVRRVKTSPIATIQLLSPDIAYAITESESVYKIQKREKRTTSDLPSEIVKENNDKLKPFTNE